MTSVSDCVWNDCNACQQWLVDPVKCNYKPSNTHIQTSQTFWSWIPRRWDMGEQGDKTLGARIQCHHSGDFLSLRTSVASRLKFLKPTWGDDWKLCLIWLLCCWRDGCSIFFTARVSFILVIQLGLLRAFPEPLESFPTLIIAAAVSSHLARVMNPATWIDIYIII